MIDGEIAEITIEQPQLTRQHILQRIDNLQKEYWDEEDKMSARLLVLASEKGITEETITPEQSQAFQTFLSRDHDQDKKVVEQAMNEFPDLFEMSQKIRQEGYIEKIQAAEDAVNAEMAQNAEIMVSEALNEFDDFFSHIDYAAILKPDQTDIETTQFDFIFNEMRYSLQSLQALKNPKEGETKLDRFYQAEQALNLIKSYKTQYQTEHFYLAESLKEPTSEQIEEAKKQIESADGIQDRIEFHNELERVIIGETYNRFTVYPPDIVRDISTFQHEHPDLDITVNPHYAIAVAEKMKVAAKALGELHTRATWADHISVDRIYKLLDDKEADEAHIDLNAANSAVDDIMVAYEGLRGGKPNGRLTSTEITRQQQFIDRLQELKKEAGHMIPSDERILNSQLTALHYLFSVGGIEQEYAKYLESVGSDKQPKTKEEEKQVMAELAVRFLHRLEDKNKEESFNYGSEAPTIGLEYEFKEPIEDEFLNRNDVFMKIQYLQQTLEKKITPELLKDRNYVDFMSGLLKSNGRLDPKDLEAHLQLLQNDLDRYNKVLFGKTDVSFEDTKALRVTLKETPTASVIASELGTFEEELDHAPSYREVITKPSNSYRIQQRELIHTMAAGSMKDTNLNIHMTIGNVELSPEHAEASDIRAVIEASGLFPEEIADEYAKLVTDENITIHKEMYWKCTRFNGELYYLPYHYVRGRQDMKRFNSPWVPEGFEIRSFSEEAGDPDLYSNRIRAIAFTNLASYAIKAAQRPSHRMDEKDKEMAEAWKTFTDEWKSNLSEVGIEYLPLDQRFSKVEVEEGSTELKYITPERYGLFLDRIRVAASRNPEFTAKVRESMRKLNLSVRKSIGDRT